MARIALYMNALGLVIGQEKCEGCDRTFERGERMAAIEADDGTAMGWICDDCIADWNRHGVKSKAVLGLFSERA